MKFSKKIFFTLLILIVSLGSVFASDNYSRITNYDIDIKVNKNNTYLVKENIDYFFHTKQRGFYRYIPYSTDDNRNAKIRDFVSSAPIADIYNENGHTVYVIGDKDKYVSGTNNYFISYLYDLPEDLNEGFDAFYFNIIGEGWQDGIERVNFKITFPNDINLENNDIKLFRGTYKSTTSSNVDFTVKGNVILGSVSKLRPNEALTILVGLEDGYFVGARKAIPQDLIFSLIIIAFSLIIFTLALVMYLKYGKDDLLIPVVNSLPPEGLNPIDIGYLYSRRFDLKSVSGLIFDWAENGFINIDYKKKEGLLSKESIVLNKIKDADDNFTLEELSLFNAFFQEGDSIDISKTHDELGKAILDTKNKISVKYSIGKFAMYESKSQTLSTLFVFLSILSIFATVFLSFILLSLNSSKYLILSIAAPILGLALSITSIITSVRIKKRTTYYNEMLGRVLGFKDFLETVEKEKLEELSKDNPHYFYKTLAYAIPLGVDKIWIKKFENISNIVKPEWLNGDDDIIPVVMCTYLYSNMNKSIMNTAGPHMAALKGGGGLHNTGGGIGGGFSGGGFGGGGGGRW